MLKSKKDTLFALIPNRIHVGDIVLTSRAAVAPFLIRFFTWSKISHVAICTRPGILIEAVPGGVIRQSVFETHASRRKWLRVVRPTRALDANKFGLSLEHYAEQKYGYEYSKIGALATLVPRWTFDDPGAIFCSRLVAEAYAEYGMDLFPGTDPRKIKPGNFIKPSELFEDVTEDCVQELKSSEDLDMSHLIRATSKINVEEEQSKITRRALKQIRKRLKSRLPTDIHSLPELRHWLSLNSPAARDADADIIGILKEQGYVDAMDLWIASVDAQTMEIEKCTAIVTQQPKVPAAEIARVVNILSEGVLVGETSLLARYHTMKEHEEMAQKAPLATLVYFRNLYRRQHECIQRMHCAYLHFVSSVKSLSNNSEQCRAPG